MPGGTTWLLAILLLFQFGWGGVFLRTWRLPRHVVIMACALMILAGLWNIELAQQPSRLMINTGGSLLPLVYGFWLARQLEWPELPGTILATACISILLLWGTEFIPQLQLSLLIVPPGYLYGALAAVLAWALTGHIRSAFLASCLGVVLADGVRFFLLLYRPDGSLGWWGGDVTFDSVVFAALVSVAVGELSAYVLRWTETVRQLGDPS